MSSQESVASGQCSSRARVVCVPVGTRHTHTGIINNTNSYHAQAHAHARRPFSEAEISAWRERIFANSSEDPVRVAVAEAVKDFGRPEDFTIWAWYCNRIGVNNFLELYFEQKSIMEKSRFPLRNPAAAFHARLKRFLKQLQQRGGAI